VITGKTFEMAQIALLVVRSPFEIASLVAIAKGCFAVREKKLHCISHFAPKRIDEGSPAGKPCDVYERDRERIERHQSIYGYGNKFNETRTCSAVLLLLECIILVYSF
jgi:hypothetical protein